MPQHIPAAVEAMSRLQEQTGHFVTGTEVVAGFVIGIAAVVAYFLFRVA
jgi:hypothetical protein